MRVVSGFPLVAIPKLKRCPEQQITILSVDEDDVERDDRGTYPDNVCRWVFGPGTHEEWPYGDYYVSERYIEPAFQNYHDFMNRVQTVGDYYALDPTLTVDVGL